MCQESEMTYAEKPIKDDQVVGERMEEVKKEIAKDEEMTNNLNNIRRRKIFVGGLPSNTSEEEFRKYFEKFGTITDLVVMQNTITGRPRGFGFITFDSEKSVEEVLEKSFHDLNGKQVEVKRVVPKEENKGVFSKGFPYYDETMYTPPNIAYLPWHNNGGSYMMNGGIRYAPTYDPYWNIWYVPMIPMPLAPSTYGISKN